MSCIPAVPPSAKAALWAEEVRTLSISKPWLPVAPASPVDLPGPGSRCDQEPTPVTVQVVSLFGHKSSKKEHLRRK